LSKIENVSKLATAKNGSEAVKKISGWIESKEVLPPVIFIDINMPVMGGFEFLAELKEMKYKTQELDEVFPVYIELLRKGSVRKGLE
jgi:CheY-like chemotaxis protein